MPDKWEDIAREKLRGELPLVGRFETPRVAKPSCPEHCSVETHETDGVVACPEHRTPMYKVVLHRYPWQDSHCWNTLEPLNGAPMPPLTKCPDCGRGLVRQWR